MSIQGNYISLWTRGAKAVTFLERNWSTYIWSVVDNYDPSLCKLLLLL